MALPQDDYANALLTQQACPLYTTLPGELRDRIFKYALEQHDDPARTYARDTPYSRPEQRARRRIHTELLRTCKAAYHETWFMPWIHADHFIYLASDERKPKGSTTIQDLGKELVGLWEKRGVEEGIAHVYVYAQLYLLEGLGLVPLLQLPHFRPGVITLTVRHADWWHWETDEELHVAGDWVGACEFPESLKEFRICFESLKRKRDQIGRVAEKARAGWFFRRKDGVVMSAEGSTSRVSEWVGSSTWMGRRWIRDEDRAEELDFYCETVTWRPVVDWPEDKEVPTPGTLRGEQDARYFQRVMSVAVSDLVEMGLEGATGEVIEEQVMNRRAHHRRMAASMPRTGIRYV